MFKCLQRQVALIAMSKPRKVKEVVEAAKSPFFPSNPSQTPSGKNLKEKLLKNHPKTSVKSTRLPKQSSIQEKDLNVASTLNKQAKWEPEDWMQILNNIRKMRKEIPAPVDTMGCHKCSDKDADPKTKRFHILVALMLSSQTKDEVTFEAMKRLREHGLSPENLVTTPHSELEQILNPVSFYRNKSKYLIKTCQVLIDDYQSDIPNTINDLVKLPGVGPKMAHICMNSAWGIVTGIGVDTHVHRIANRLKWTSKETKEPEKTRLELEKWVPFELWDEINVLLVGFGQTVCIPVGPKCGQCLNNQVCPAAFKGKKQETIKNLKFY